MIGDAQERVFPVIIETASTGGPLAGEWTGPGPTSWHPYYFLQCHFGDRHIILQWPCEGPGGARTGDRVEGGYVGMGHENGAVCSKCGREPRSGSNRWGKTCIAESVKRSREKRGDEKRENEALAPVIEQAIAVLGPPSGKPWRESLAKLIWPEGSEFEPAEGVHCEGCGHPAGRFTPPVEKREDGREWRVLGSDPRGWAPEHGPDYGLVCCRTFLCYDARPGHRRWQQIGAA